jgi:hypothetical protein
MSKPGKVEPPDAGDLFERVKDVMRKLSLSIDLVDQCVEVARAINTFEARRCLDRARTDIKTAIFWIDEAKRAAEAREVPR